MAARFAGLSAAVLAAVAGLLLPAAASANDFAGNWYNIDADTAGITRMEIRQRPDRLEIHPFGRCHPTDCDWGSRPVEEFLPRTAGQSPALRAEFGRRGDRIHTMVIIRLEQGLLRAETFTVFADERQPYWAVYQFRTEDPRPSAPVPAVPVQPR
jgi:hypothetical protein